MSEILEIWNGLPTAGKVAVGVGAGVMVLAIWSPWRKNIAEPTQWIAKPDPNAGIPYGDPLGGGGGGGTSEPSSPIGSGNTGSGIPAIPYEPNSGSIVIVDTPAEPTIQTPVQTATPHSIQSAGTGNNGQGTATPWEVLKQDVSEYDKEVTRTYDVITNRITKGEDISQQITHLNRLKALPSSPKPAPKSATIPSATHDTSYAGTGNDGKGKWVGEDFWSTMKTDDTLKQREIQRTLDVIHNRQAAGLDTSLQYQWLRTIKG